MHLFKLISPHVTIVDPQERDIEDVAVYDESLFTNYMLSAKLTGSEANVSRLKRLIYTLLNLWSDGERHISITCGEMTLELITVQHIVLEPGQIQLGEPPADPEQEVLVAMRRLSSSIIHSSPNKTELYQQLQDLLGKYPTLQIKEQA